ncbi:hypothetical protein CASFOL_039098 [Castilleja foliolosa]|uniref:Uncharacterized protein n=1 Tax=Castilleja foliolosa TaxID=1961234 RepID=A0ABD3BHJ1_9LAMI
MVAELSGGGDGLRKEAARRMSYGCKAVDSRRHNGVLQIPSGGDGERWLQAARRQGNNRQRVQPGGDFLAERWGE